MDSLHGTQSWAMYRKKHDPFGLTDPACGENLGGSKYQFLIRAILKGRGYDILHIHSMDILLPLLRIYGKPMILHYHGSRVRQGYQHRGTFNKFKGGWDNRQKFWKYADQILVSTPDLLQGAPAGTRHIPNPIDLNRLYSYLNDYTGPLHRNTAFHVSRYAEDLATEYADKFNLDRIDILDQGPDRNQHILPHPEFIRTLASYEYYIDVKRDYWQHIDVLKARSITGLEALALGLKVIDYKGELSQGLPIDHDPNLVANNIFNIYQEVIN